MTFVAHHIVEVRFNIRSFGSWIASYRAAVKAAAQLLFQYPLFRIVDCF